MNKIEKNLETEILVKSHIFKIMISINDVIGAILSIYQIHCIISYDLTSV